MTVRVRLWHCTHSLFALTFELDEAANKPLQKTFHEGVRLMKRSISIVALTVLFGTAAVAQEMQPAEPSSSTTEVQPIASTPTVPVLVSDTRGQSDSDARECLQFSGNDEIHRC